MINRVSHDLCCGCMACYDSCPVNAITFKKDEWGFLCPELNCELCLNCGKCLSACGAYHEGISKDKSTIKLYAAQNTDNSTLKNSSSGGAFSVIAQYVLDANGIVCAASFDENLILKHRIVSAKSDLLELMGSKYLQSNTKGIYKDVKKHLDSGVFVMFVGTPCQVRALKLFLNKEYDNLVAVDIICHGVPSQDFFDKYIQYISRKYKRKVKNISFRDKIQGWKNFCVKIGFDGGKTIYESIGNNLYMRLFLKNFSIRNSCYNCQSNKYKSGSDITLGDFWNIELINKDFSDNKGTSAILLNTRKGAEIFEKVKNRFHFCEEQLEELVKNNHVLETSVAVPAGKERFIHNYSLKNIDRIDDLCLCTSHLDRIKKRIKRVIRRIR